MLETRKRAQPPRRVRRVRREQSGSRLDEVLNVAAAHFATHGYVLATLEDIGAELGMTRPALYYYAKSKEDLLIQCYNRIHAHFEKRLKDVVVGTTGLERLKQFFLVYSEIICDDAAGGFLAALGDRSRYRNEVIQRELGKRASSVNKIVGSIIDKGVADGSIAPCDKRYVIAALFGAFRVLPQLKRGSGDGHAEMGSKMMQVLLEGLSPR